MAPLRQYQRQDDFSLGEVTAVAPHLIPENGVSRLVNRVLLDDGGAAKRGGVKYYSESGGGATPTGKENLFPNPSTEVVTPWSAAAGSVARVQGNPAAPAKFGDFLTSHSTAAPAQGASEFLTPSLANGTYRMSCYFWIPSSSAEDDTVVFASVGGGTATVINGAAGLNFGIRDAWQRVSFSFQVTSPGTVRISAQWFSERVGIAFYTDGIQLETGSSATTYVDGDQPNAQWAGTPHNSTSQELGGTSPLTFLADVNLGPGRRTVLASDADFYVLDDNRVPINLGAVDGLPRPKPFAIVGNYMFIAEGWIYAGSRETATYSAGTASINNGSTVLTGAGTSWLANADPGMLLQFGDERVYRVRSVDSNTQITLAEPYVGANKAGAAYTLYPIYQIDAADPYPDAEVYGAGGGRLLWADGSQLRMSFPVDPDTGLPNPHQFAVNDYHDIPDGVVLTGIYTVGANTIVFTTGGIFVATALAYDIAGPDGSPQHTVVPLSREIILWGQQGIAQWEQMLVVPCIEGVYLIDGTSSPQRVSETIDPSYQKYSQRVSRYPGQAEVHGNHYFLPVVNGAGVPQECFVCRLDLVSPGRMQYEPTSQQRRPWSRFMGYGGRVPAFAQHGADPDTLLAASGTDDGMVLDASGYLKPDSTNIVDADGSNIDADLILRDIETGNQTVNVVRHERTEYVLEDADGSNPTLKQSFSLGLPQSGLPILGEVILGQFVLAGEGEGLAFVSVAPDALENPTGIDPHIVRVNEPARRMRWRIRSSGRSSSDVIRSVELASRPSRAVRR